MRRKKTIVAFWMLLLIGLISIFGNGSIVEAATCTDSDGGNLYSKGYCQDYRNSNNGWDVCSDGVYSGGVLEYDCTYASYLSQYVCGTKHNQCPYGCEDGACKSAPATNKPDLSVTNIIFRPTDPKVGDTLYGYVTIKNSGSVVASGVDVLLRDQNGWGNSTTITAINPNQSLNAYIRLTVSSIHATNNPHNFVAKADYLNAITESNESNNEMSKSLTVSAIQQEQEDLATGVLYTNNTSAIKLGGYASFGLRAKDAQGVSKVKLYFRGKWYTTDCGGETDCLRNWMFDLPKVPGVTYRAYGYVYGKKVDGTEEFRSATPSSVTVTVEATEESVYPPTNVSLNTYLIQDTKPAVGIQFTKDSNADKTNIYRSSSQYSLGDKIAFAESITGWTDSEVVGGQTYYYTFSSVDANGKESEKTNKYSIKVILGGEQTCTDSDGGSDYYVKGWVQDYYDKESVYDYCTLDGKEVFSCTDINKNCGIIEKSCTDFNRRSGEYLSGDKFDSTCPYGCKDGACIREQEKSIKMISPNDGEKWQRGKTYNIKWKASSDIETIYLYLYKKNNFVNGHGEDISHQRIATNVSASSGQYSWTIPDNDPNFFIPGDGYKVKILAFSSSQAKYVAEDFSDDYFSITQAAVDGGITLTYPNGGQRLVKGHLYSIKWNSFLLSDIAKVNIDLYKGTQLAWRITSGAENEGNYSWIPAESLQTGSNYKIKIAGLKEGSFIYDKSDSYFSIVDVSNQSCTDSDGGKNYYTKGTTDIAPGASGGEAVDYCDSTSRSLVEYFCTADGSNGGASSVFYACPNGCEDGACIKEADKSVKIISPNGGEEWVIGEQYEIHWTGDKNAGTGIVSFAINLYKNNVFIKQIVTNLDLQDEGTYSWTVPSGIGTGTGYKIRMNDFKSYDFSDREFSITNKQPEGSIRVISPNGGESLRGGITNHITWNSQGVDKVNIELQKGSKAWHLVYNYPATSGRYFWKTSETLEVGDDYKINIWDAENATLEDKSDEVFSITKLSTTTTESIQVTYPNGGEEWIKGNTYNIRWESIGDIDTVSLILWRIDSHGQFIMQGIVNDGSDSWTIPNNINPGTYKIRVSENNGDATDISDSWIKIIEKQLPSSDCLPEGTLIKMPGDYKVYVIRNCERVWVRTQEEFEQQGYKWEDVQETSTGTTVAQSKQLQSNARLLREIGDSKVYYITESGMRRHIPTAKVFNSYGNKWEDITEVDKATIDSYGDNVLIKTEGDEKVYELKNEIKRWIKTAEAFNRLGYDWNRIAPVNRTEMNTYQEGSSIQ